MVLTRADLESRRLQEMIAQSGLKIRMLTEAELLSSIERMLQYHPSTADIWLFAYGSLIPLVATQ